MITKLKIRISIFLIGAFTFFNCSDKENKENSVESNLVAEISENKLYLSEIKNIMPKNISKQDSISFVNQYINEWIKKIVLYKKAEEDDLLNDEIIEAKIEKYKQELFIYELEKRYVLKNLDTALNEDDINKYYQENINEFTLKQDILKCFYLKLAKNAPNIDLAQKLMQAKSQEEIDNLKSYAYTYSKQYSFAETYEPVQSFIDSSPLDKNSLQYNKNIIRKDDNEFTYFIKVIDYQIGNKPAPLVFVRNQIMNIILNKRKVDLIKKFEDDLFEEAKKGGSYKIY